MSKSSMPRTTGSTKTYAITYSYATWDRNYRGQRGIRVEATDESAALAKIRKGHGGYGPCPSATIVRCKLVTRKGA